MYSQIVTAPSLVRNGGWLPESLSRPLTGVAPLAETGFSSGVGGSVFSPQRGLTSRRAGGSLPIFRRPPARRSQDADVHLVGRRAGAQRLYLNSESLRLVPVDVRLAGWNPLVLHAPPEAVRMNPVDSATLSVHDDGDTGGSQWREPLLTGELRVRNFRGPNFFSASSSAAT